jgi:hypothetical protein
MAASRLIAREDLMTHEHRQDANETSPRQQNKSGTPEEPQGAQLPKTPPADDHSRQVQDLAEDLEADEGSDSGTLEEGSGSRLVPG